MIAIFAFHLNSNFRHHSAYLEHFTPIQSKALRRFSVVPYSHLAPGADGCSFVGCAFVCSSLAISYTKASTTKQTPRMVESLPTQGRWISELEMWRLYQILLIMGKLVSTPGMPLQAFQAWKEGVGMCLAHLWTHMKWKHGKVSWSGNFARPKTLSSTPTQLKGSHFLTWRYRHINCKALLIFYCK